MLVFSLAWSALYFAAVCAAARSNHRTAIVVAVSPAALLLPLFIFFFSYAVSLQIAFVLLATIICARRRAGALSFCYAVAAASVVAYGCAALVAAREQRQIAQLAQRYPIESLTNRLAYEQLRQSADREAGLALASHQVSANWQDINRHQEGGNPWRELALWHLHGSTVNRFINSPAFGVARMPNLTNDHWVSRGDDPPVTQRKVLPADNATPSPTGENLVPDVPARHQSQLPQGAWRLHSTVVEDFLLPERYGLIRSRDEVGGFLSHRIGPRTLERMEGTTPQPDRLELVSLLKFSEPRVYVSEFLPNMNELRDAQTRPLDAFEQQALASLQAGEDIVANLDVRPARALGALRALDKCLNCHTAEKGQLLGAFSYRWEEPLVTPVQVEKPADST